jgi:hypothetical protein
VLGEFTLAHIHLAAPADGAAAADGIDIDAKRARRLQHGRSDGKRPRLPDGVKTIKGFWVIVYSSLSLWGVLERRPNRVRG